MRNKRTILCPPSTKRRQLCITWPDGTMMTFSSWPALIGCFPEWEKFRSADTKQLQRKLIVKRFGVTLEKVPHIDHIHKNLTANNES